MKKILINELNRQLKLMGVNKILSEGVITNWARDFFQASKVGVGVSKRNDLIKLFDESIKEVPIGGFKTFEDLEKNLDIFFRTGRSNVAESDYTKLALKMLEKLSKETTNYKQISEIMLKAYRGVNGVVAGTPSGDIIEKMISLAKTASKSPDDLKVFNQISQDLISRRIVDPSIPNLIKNIYYNAIIPNDVIKTIDGFVTYLKGLPGIKQIYEINAKKEMDRLGMQSTFDQIESILRQFDDSLIEGNNINFDEVSARNTLSKLSEKVSYGKKDMLRFLWLDVKKRLPQTTITQLEDANGVLNYNNLNEWFTYFEKAAGAEGIKKPNEYIGRLKALIRIFNDPVHYKNVKTFGKIKLASERLINEYFKGSARLKDEIVQIEKVLGKKGKLGFNIGERLVAYVFYYPLIGAFLQTIGDYLENTGSITNDGKGFNIPLIGVVGKDWSAFHGETWNTPGKRTGSNIEGLWNSFAINSKQFINPFSTSFQQISVISPALADLINKFATNKAGDNIDLDELNKTKRAIIVEQTDTLQKIQIEGGNDSEIKKFIDTVGMEPLNKTNEIFKIDTIQ
jgi:hypothetical protein